MSAVDVVFGRVVADDGFRVSIEVVEAVVAGIHPLRAWREHRGLTRDALAALAGVSAPYLSQIEGGKRAGEPSEG